MSHRAAWERHRLAACGTTAWQPGPIERDNRVVTPADFSAGERSFGRRLPLGRGWTCGRGDAQKDDLAQAGAWEAGRTIRAEVITALLLGAAPLEPGHFPAVRLRGAPARRAGHRPHRSQWFSYLLVAAGWVLATTIAAAPARIISRR